MRTACKTEVVGRFYDRHPYPPPVSDLGKDLQIGRDTTRKRAEYHLWRPTQPYRENLQILVAGCGTSQSARYALRWPGAQVTGIDLSATSIEHTGALKHKYDLTNLNVRQLPIERCRELDERFDLIVCTGVLHHLPDPDAGLAALRSVLKRDGAMRIMVYAQYGRTGVYMLQEYARRLGIGASDEELADLVAVLTELPEGHPLEHLLRSAPDFRRRAALADALLHPVDRAYTVPELYAYLVRNGMVFGRWVRQAPYLPRCGSPAATPHAARLAALPPPEQHAALELFRGTMVRHALIAYRNDADMSQPSFDEDGPWLSYVPLRMPHTRCISEKLPPGAAAVLLNQSHVYPDLYLPVNGREKQLFDAIDGDRTIGEIMAASANFGRDKRGERRARRFFERLWAYDQIVIGPGHC